MPELGEIKKAKEIGRRGTHRYIWGACPICGKERWIQTPSLRNSWCKSCHYRVRLLEANGHGEEHPSWKGGRNKTGKGYIVVFVPFNDFFRSMTDGRGYVAEHRLVMAKSLGRCLHPWEIVHHKGIRYDDIRNKSDNLEDNLELTGSISEHSRAHSKGYRDGYAKGLQDGKDQQIEDLRKEIKLLQWHISELTSVRR